MPNRFIINWDYNWSHNGYWDAPLTHGFSHSQTWGDAPYAASNPTPVASTPINRRSRAIQTIGCFENGQPWLTKYNTSAAMLDLKSRAEYFYKTGIQLNYIAGVCPATPTSYTSITNAGGTLNAAFLSGGTYVANSGLLGLDYETQFGIEWGWPGNLDNWLTCLKDNNTTTYPCTVFNGTFTNSVFRPSTHGPTNPTLQAMSFSEFKKYYFRNRIKEMNAPFEFYKSLVTSSPAKMFNWSSNIEDPAVFIHDPSVTWSQLTTDPSKLNWLFLDTTNFTSFGNHFVDNQDIMVPSAYFWGGTLGYYGASSGHWLQGILFQIELTKAWLPSKPCSPSFWLKDDSPTPVYTNWKDTLVAEAMPIFALMSGSDGFMLWDNQAFPNANQHIYDYLIKGMRRLSHFNSILTPTTVTLYRNFDPVQLRTMQIASQPTNTYTFGIARGIVKGDSILVAVMNPNASEKQITKVPISFANVSYTFSDTVTLVGRQVFLGISKMTSLGVSSVINSIFEKSNNALIYPNPSKSTISIKGMDDVENIKSIVIRDILGREMFVTNKINEINIEGLQTGNYFVSIYSNENVLLKTLRFIKE